jgi:hypothetical protein
MTTTFSLPCPQCGSALLISHDESTTEPQPEDRMICPVHGDVGSHADFEPTIRDMVEKEAKRMIDDMIGEAFRKF